MVLNLNLSQRSQDEHGLFDDDDIDDNDNDAFRISSNLKGRVS